MPLSALDPTCALIMVDLRQGLVETVFRAVVESSCELAGTFRARGAPVVLVNATGVAPGWMEQPGRIGQLPPTSAEVVDGCCQTNGNLSPPGAALPSPAVV